MTNAGSGPRPEQLLGQRLRTGRLARGWEQEDVVKRMREAGFTWHQSTASKTEAGSRPLRLDEAAALAHILGVSVNDLIRFDLDALSERIEEARTELAIAERRLRRATDEASAANHEREEARQALERQHRVVEALQNLAELGVDAHRPPPASLLARLVGLLGHSEVCEVLADAGYSQEVIASVPQPVKPDRPDAGSVADQLRAMLRSIEAAQARANEGQAQDPDEHEYEYEHEETGTTVIPASELPFPLPPPEEDDEARRGTA